MSDVELKPCPFCGYDEASVKERRGSHDGLIWDFWEIECRFCFARVSRPQLKHAKELWNTRTPADRDALADALAQVWRLLERGADPGMAIEVIANALGVNESPKPTDRKYLSGTWMPGLRDLEHTLLSKALIAWAADEERWLQSTCHACGGPGAWNINKGFYGHKHDPDCLHLRARALQGDEATRGRIEEEE